MASLRVVTINTGKGDGPYAARLDALVDGLRALDADVVLCQEVFEAIDGSASTSLHLASALGLNVVSCRIRRKTRAVEAGSLDSWSSLATLTRLPIREVVTLPLPTVEADGERSALLLALDAGSFPIRIGNTHLTHLRGEEGVRRAQLRAVASDPWWGGKAAARLLAGDFNARPDDPLHAALRAGEDGWSGLDAYETGGGDPGRGATIRTARGEARVDFVYSLARDGDEHAAADGARVVLNQANRSGVLPSDHFGVAVTFRL